MRAQFWLVLVVTLFALLVLHACDRVPSDSRRTGRGPGTGISKLPAVSHVTDTITIDGRSFQTEVVKVNLNKVRIKVGLGQGRVGGTQSLGSIAKSADALAAINGTFFDAYSGGSGPRSPYHPLITDGRVVHVGDVGSMIGFDSRNRGRIARVQWSILGSCDGAGSWYANGINHTPANSAKTVYDSHWGDVLRTSAGTKIVAQRGRVLRICEDAEVAIPADGFVLHYRQSDPDALRRFKVGQRIAYDIRQRSAADPFWNSVREGLGSGPLLVDDGKVVWDPEAEGFRHAKILRDSGARSAVGLTSDGLLLMVATTGTTKQLASIMQTLGCQQAMNLDGGASSGLWLQGKYLRKPGREISNALLVLDK